jgi:hypothetical protein
MKMADFERLKKFLTLATSENDNEALQSWRRATDLIRAYGFTWDQVMDKRIVVINGVQAAPEGSIGTHTPPPMQAEPLEEEDFDMAMRGVTGDFLVTLESIYQQWQDGAHLSPKQVKVIRDAAERAACRHPGGRWK